MLQVICAHGCKTLQWSPVYKWISPLGINKIYYLSQLHNVFMLNYVQPPVRVGTTFWQQKTQWTWHDDTFWIEDETTHHISDGASVPPTCSWLWAEGNHPQVCCPPACTQKTTATGGPAPASLRFWWHITEPGLPQEVTPNHRPSVITEDRAAQWGARPRRGTPNAAQTQTQTQNQHISKYSPKAFLRGTAKK